MSDFDADIDEIKKVAFLRRLGPAMPLIERPLSRYISRSNVLSALAVFPVGLSVALLLAP